MDYLIDLSFQGVNRLLVWSFDQTMSRTVYKRYFLTAVEIDNWNFMNKMLKCYD